MPARSKYFYRLFLPYIIGTLLNVISNCVYADDFNNYHNLSSNLLESENYELIKLFNGEIEAVLYVKETSTVLVVTEDFLWKIDENGHVIDSLDRHLAYSSGMMFYEDGFNDWVYSGDKYNKKYSDIVDTSEMADEEIFKLMDQAKTVEFKTWWKEAQSYIELEDRTLLLDISKLKDQVDNNCDKSESSKYSFYNFGWNKSCLQGYQRKYQDRIIFLPHTSGRFANWYDHSLPMVLKKFTKTYYHLEEGVSGELLSLTLGRYLKSQGMPGELSKNFWYGSGYFQLTFNHELFNLKALVANEDDEIQFDNITFYDLPENDNPAFMLLGISYLSLHDYEHNLKLTSLYEDDVGLYVVRKKAKESSTHNAYLTKKQWYLNFSDKQDKGGQWADIHYFNKAGEKTHLLNHETVIPPKLNTIPQKITINWPSVTDYFAYKLYFGNDYIWLPVHRWNKRIYFDITFDEKKIVAAFRQLENRSKDLKLDLTIEPVDDTTGRLSINLSNGRKSIPLQQASILQKSTEDTDEGELIVKFEKDVMKIEYENALKNQDAIEDFFKVTKEIALTSPYVKRYAYHFAYYTVKLMINRARAADFKGDESIIYHYVNTLLPYSGKHQKTSDVASNALVVAIMKNNKDIENLVFEKLLGDDFNVETENNEILLFNLSCLYALRQDKESLLQTTRRAIKLGKKAEDFLSDRDLKAYWKDEDFLQALQTEN